MDHPYRTSNGHASNREAMSFPELVGPHRPEFGAQRFSLCEITRARTREFQLFGFRALELQGTGGPRPN